MGKASKWIRNFLIGKKEERYKQIDGAAQRGSTSSEVESSKVKRKWSFGRRTGKVTEQKVSTSYDLTDSTKHQIIQALPQTRPSHSLPTPTPFSEVENAAAIKIQAAFRSYLGRKALHALRGLVKLQALVRGHLVRKQTTATLRSMHALMSIQVRARIHRIQMQQESYLLGEISRDSKDTSLREMLQVLRSRSGPLDRHSRRSIEHPSVSKRHHRYSAPNSPEDHVVLSGFNPTKSLSIFLRHDQPWEPNYMTETESSRAKARSASEPKQRPRRSVRHRNKPTESMKESISPLDGGRQYIYSNSARFNPGKVGLLGY